MSEDDFRKICIRKLEDMLTDANGRNIWIYGAGRGGRILFDILMENHIDVEGYVDRQANKLKKQGFKVVSIKEVYPKQDFLLVSIMTYDIRLVEELADNGFDYMDYYIISAGEFFNKNDIIYNGCHIGKHTYGYEYLLSYGYRAKSIGRYCSINHTAKIMTNHHSDTVTTHPFLTSYQDYTWDKRHDRLKMLSEHKAQTGGRLGSPLVTIGNDVWIGYNVLIMPGITIGDGAILGAGAVVTKDVRPYEVVAGVPARHLRYRFSKEIINGLLKIQWWNWSEEQIEQNIELFYHPEEFVKNFLRE